MDYGMLINGRIVQTPERDDVINPALGAAFASCPRGSTAHVDEAVTAAAGAYKTWRTDEALRRAKIAECAAAIQGRVQDIAMLLSQEQGKPLTAAMAEVFGASMWFSYYAALQIEPEVISDDGEKHIKVVRKPLGVVAAITPWNFPVILMAWKLAPAFLAGNTVVAKPSPFTPLTSLMLGDILKDVLPAGVLNILSGSGELGATLAKHPLVRKISFTGSVATGKKIAAYAADDLKRVTLELGGNDPAIVLDDVDPAAVADGLFWGAFQNSGQVCSAIKRLYVHEKVYQPIVERADRAREDGEGRQRPRARHPARPDQQQDAARQGHGHGRRRAEERRDDRDRRRAPRQPRLLLSADHRHRRARRHAAGRRGAVRHRAADHQVHAT